MKLHLLTTDVSVFRLVDALGSDVEVTSVIVPGNRVDTQKIRLVQAEAERRSILLSVHALHSAFNAALPPADGAVSWLYSQIIRNEDLVRYRRGTLNMHGGRIPDYRGANVLQWAIINGEKELGVTWHEMVDEVDAGAIWAEGEVPIGLDDTAWNVRGAMIEKGIELFPLAWHNMISRTYGRIPDLRKGNVWPIRKPADGRITQGLSERKVRDLVRALCPPWPAAFIDTPNGLFSVGAVMDVPSPQTVLYETAEGRTIYLERARVNDT
jgi:methionyl-tRNA formyltransferase